ncbi:MAG: hypothetical protein K2K96_04305 [Lachnospiraceae bacterium]|nr:hypothetical protein [Lachnospiraceae bacterium]
MYDIIRKEKTSTKSIKNSRLIQKKSKPHTTINSNDIRICYNSYQSNNVTQFCGFRQLDINKAIGRSVEDLAWEQYSPQFQKAAKQVAMNVNTGSGTSKTIIVDIVGQKADGSFVLLEVKSSRTASFTDNQKIAYPEIYNNGATIISPNAIRLFQTSSIPNGTGGFRVEL